MMDFFFLLPTILILLVLFALSAFFSCAETALTASSRARMHALAKDGDRRAQQVNEVLADKDRLIGAILLGSNVVNTLSAAISTSVMISLFGDAGVIYATAVVTVILLLFSEVMPKTVAMYYADRIALLVVPVIRWVIILSRPVTSLVSIVARTLLRGIGIDIGAVSYGSDVEELRGAIDLHQGPGEETAQRRVMLRSILDLADVQVGDIMLHRRSVHMVDLDMPAADLVDHVLSQHFSRVPLWKESPDNIVGVIHVRQLLRALYEVDGDATRLDLTALVGKPWFIPETTSLLDQLQAFRSRREHFAIVVDEYGSFEGVVTLEDILEEIVGEIDDEQDLVVPGVHRLSGGAYLVGGDLTIRDLNRELGWSLPDDRDYATVAGLVIHESRKIPDPGQSFSFHGFQFDVVKRQRNQITLLRITPPAVSEAAGPIS